jgi:tetratricopeptide (TPR) repeat protein
MGKQRKRRWDRKRTQQQKKHSSDKKTPESLIAQGNLQEAVRLLRGYIRTTPSDDKKRLLGQSLFQLGDYREAAQVWLVIQEKTAHDLALVGMAFLALEEWDQAVEHLRASLQLEERGYRYYCLALAQRKNRDDYRLDAEEKGSILDLLQKACMLPACPVEAFLWLDDLVRGGDHDDERTALLQEAFARYPDVEEVRFRLSDHLLYHLCNYEGALMVVTPLLAKSDPSQRALACAFWASQKAGLFEKALAYTESMHKSPFQGPGLAKAKGDLYLASGKIDEAISSYEQETQSGDFTAMFIGFFSIAAAWLTQQQTSKAIAAAAQGAYLWFANPNDSQCDEAVFHEPVSIGMGADWVYIGNESISDCVKDVCVALLAEEQQVELPLKGQLSYLLYKYHTNHRSAEPEKNQTELLLQAAQWFEHPHMSLDLAYHYRSAGDLPLALQHHLAFCLWQFATLKTYHPLPPASDDADESRSGPWYKQQWEFHSYIAQFIYYDEMEEDEEAVQETQCMAEEVRRECHEVGWKFLQAHQDPDVIVAIFLPFYRSFWRRILDVGDMHQELVDVLAFLLNASLAADTDDELWSYAYTLSKLGRAEEAECAYRSYLERHPNHAATLHNLALLAEERGLLQEALELSNQAAALAPDDEIIVQENSRFKREYEEQERSRGNAAEQERLRASSQERAHLWSLLSNSQKRLLCLMELYPSAHWSALLPHVKNDEHQLCQVQEDWEWLLAHGVCSQAEAGTSVCAVPLLQPCVFEEGLRCWLSAEIARAQARKKKNLWLPVAADLGDEQLAQLSSTQRDLLQHALMRQIERVAPSGLEQFHLRFYRRVWKQLLIEWKMYAALVDLCEQFLTRLSVISRRELWECAYYATHLSDFTHRNIAEKRYTAYLEQGEDRAAYHNLSIIYLERSQYQDAMRMIEHALQLDPQNAESLKQKACIEQAIQEVEEQRRQREIQQQREKAQREQRLKDLEQKIQAHLVDVVDDYYKKKILQSLKHASYFRGKQSFAKYLAMEDWALEGHWRKLVAWGMIVEDGRQTMVHPLISTYLEQGWPVVSGSPVKTKEHKVHEESSLVLHVKELVMGDQIRNQIGDISNISGQLFIGKFNNVIADLKSNGQTELAEALKTLEEAVMVSEVLLDSEKQEQVEVVNHIGEEAAKPKPNKTLLKVLGDGLMTTLKSVPDVAKAVTAVAPVFAQWHH